MWVKICGLTRQEDADVAIAAGADALGFVFEGSSPRFIGVAADDIVVPSQLEKVAVFGELEATVPASFTAVQFVSGTPQMSTRHRKAFQVRRLGVPVTTAGEFMSADVIVIDAYHESQFGGTGKTVDWDEAASFVISAMVPVVLAGGLTPDNVAEAILRVQPWGVDVSSGVEQSPGVKDAGKIRAFVEAAKASG